MIISNKESREKDDMPGLRISPEVQGLYFKIRQEDQWQIIPWKKIIMREIGLKTLPMALEIVLLDFLHNDLRIEGFNDHGVMQRKVADFVKNKLMKEVA